MAPFPSSLPFPNVYSEKYSLSTMTTSSGSDGFCSRCGHPIDGHAAQRDSKCRKCKQAFVICQVGYHGEGGHAPEGWRICFLPCHCGVEYYPDKVRAARPLESHEYKPDHPGFRPLGDGWADTTADYTASECATDYTTTAYTTSDYMTTAYPTADYVTTAYTVVDLATSAAAASGDNAFQSERTQAQHSRQPSEGSEDPIASPDTAASGTAAPVRQKRARHVRFDSQGTDDPLTVDYQQPQAVSELADMFTHVDIGGSTTAADPSNLQTFVEDTAGGLEPIPVATEVKKGTIRFQDPEGNKYKTKPEEWQEISTEAGSYFMFTNQYGQPFCTWDFGSAPEDQATGSEANSTKTVGKGKGKAGKAKEKQRKK